jgi:hypothetical protein
MYYPDFFPLYYTRKYEKKKKEGDRRHPIVVYIDNAFILYKEGRVLYSIVFFILFFCRLRKISLRRGEGYASC